MSHCIIHPIQVAEIQADKSGFTWLFGAGETLNLASYIWYIEGTDKNILVDAGCKPEYFKVSKGARETQSIASGLSKVGLRLSDINLVIITHLHHDHVAGASQFPNAKFLVQKDELEFAQNPHPTCASWWCPKHLIEGLNFEVINGDAKISEEVSVFRTPGHTPGGQSVSIRTAQGVAVIAGLCTIRENFFPVPPVTLPVIIPGLCLDPFAAYDSLLSIKKTADIVVPLHELCKSSSIP
jgi:N-acyl homoserine lactone hydrolase